VKLTACYRAPVLCAGLVLLVQGCSSPVYYPPRDARTPPPVVDQSVPAPAPLPAPPASAPQQQAAPVARAQPPAVVALLDTAEQQANAGDLEAAAASLERAIRIDPRNPVLWYHLATVRLSQGDAQAAEQLASKSNSLAPDNTVQLSRNWLLIARARRAQHDEKGAVAAEQRARELAGQQ
jgi:predicted Zn-dependent protease